MLRQKSHELSWKILAQFKGKATTYDFTLIEPIILKFLEAVYIQARKDQIDKIPFDELKDGSIHFQTK